MNRAAPLVCTLALIACGPTADQTGPVAPTPAPANQAEPPATRPAPPAPRPVKPAVIAKVKDLWLALPTSKESCGDFDYFPGGGLKSFACHLDFANTLGWLDKAWGSAMFTKGPHGAGRLDLSNGKSFGHYNPDFVRFLVDHLVPAASDPAFRARTQPTYDKFVRPLAKTFVATYDKFAADPACLKSEVARYKTLLDGPGVPEMDYERLFFFMNDHFCDNPEAGFDFFSDRGFDNGYGGNVVKTCAAFWIRRTIDGTAPLFYDGLKKLMAAYEPHAP